MRLLVTGGCGFIGSHFIRAVLAARKAVRIVNLDALTYAGNPANLGDAAKDPRYEFRRGSIVDGADVEGALCGGVDVLVNFAAESHVDRSLAGASEFVRTNLQGTATLLEAAKQHGVRRYVQISTDEVYGSAPAGRRFREDAPLHPNNPYSSSKAAADLMVLAYARSYGLDAVIVRPSNNYGPNQHPEKFIPLFATKALEGRPVPLYGDGQQIREWIQVGDTCRGILSALEKGRAGEIYNLGGGNERRNLVVARLILKHLGVGENRIRFVEDRPGHDRRYAMNSGKVRRELRWSPRIKFEAGLKETLDWYRSHPEWIAQARSGEGRNSLTDYARRHPAPDRQTTPVMRRRKP